MRPTTALTHTPVVDYYSNTEITGRLLTRHSTLCDLLKDTLHTHSQYALSQLSKAYSISKQKHVLT